MPHCPIIPSGRSKLVLMTSQSCGSPWVLGGLRFWQVGATTTAEVGSLSLFQRRMVAMRFRLHVDPWLAPCGMTAGQLKAGHIDHAVLGPRASLGGPWWHVAATGVLDWLPAVQHVVTLGEVPAGDGRE